MKTRNFPAKKNARRVKAFSRLPMLPTETIGMTTAQKIRARRLKEEAKSLSESIIRDEVARSVRTKKKRGVGIR